MNPLRVLCVDDHILFRRGLMELLRGDDRIGAAGEAANGTVALDAARRLVPDVVVMDLHMPVCGGVEATRRLRAQGFDGGILALTVSEKDEDLFAVMQAGANGYVLKDADLDELVSAIIQVARGGMVLSPRVAGSVLAKIGHVGTCTTRVGGWDDHGLTEREHEILLLAAKGIGTRAMAEELFLSVNTVKSHLRNILAKLGLQSRYELVSYAARMGSGGGVKGGGTPT